MRMATSIQQRLYPFSTCYGCGPANNKGLQLQSFEEGDEVVCTFHPEEHHSNGMGTLSGGVIATLLDCHSGAAVFVESARRSASGAEFQPWVTTGLEIRYRLPTLLDTPSELRARILDAESDVMAVQATLRVEGKVRVQAESRWVRIDRK